MRLQVPNEIIAALSFTRPQQVCPAFFAHPLASSSAALGRDKERPNQLR
jgi:hypothetical protein